MVGSKAATTSSQRLGQEPLPGEDPAFVKPAEEEEAKVGALVQDHTMPNPVNPMHPL